MDLHLEKDLESFAKDAADYEQELLGVLEESTITSTKFEELSKKACSMKIMGDACKEFVKVVAVYNIAIAIQTAQKLPRIPINTITDIIANIKQLEGSGEMSPNGNISSLRQCLISEIRQNVDGLNQSMEEISDIKMTARDSLQRGLYQDSHILSALKSMRVITVEEITMDYLSKINHLLPQAELIQMNVKRIKDNLNTSERSAMEFHPPQDLDLMITSLQDILSTKLALEFDVVTRRINDVKRCYDDLMGISLESKQCWDKLSEFIKQCHMGFAGPYDEFQGLYDSALLSGIKYNQIDLEAKELERMTQEYTISCNSLLVMDIQESLGQGIHEIMSNAEDMMHKSSIAPIDINLSRKIKRYHNICKVVSKCKEMMTSIDLENKSIAVNSSIYQQLKDLRHHIERLLLQELDLSESNILRFIQSDFLLFEWQYEVRYALANKLSIEDVKAIYQIGLKLADSAENPSNIKDTSEYQTTSNAVIHAEEFEKEALSLTEELVQIKSKTNDMMNDLTDGETRYMQTYQFWSESTSSMAIAIDDSIKKESMLYTSHPSVVAQLKDWSILIYNMNKVWNTSNMIREKLRLSLAMASEKREAKGVNKSSYPHRQGSQVIDLKQLSIICNAINNIFEKDLNRSFVLLHMIVQEINKYYQESNQWNENTLTLLPQRSTRLKVSSTNKQRTVEDIETALNVPIAQAVYTPMHEKIYEVLKEVDLCKTELLDIIIPSRLNQESSNTVIKSEEMTSLETMNDTMSAGGGSERSNQANGTKDETRTVNTVTEGPQDSAAESATPTSKSSTADDAMSDGEYFKSDGDNQSIVKTSEKPAIEPDYEYTDVLYSESQKLNHLQQRMELIPLDLPELKVVRWLGALYAWMLDAPCPFSDTIAKVPLNYSSAKQKYRDGVPLIAEIPPELVGILIKINVIMTDDKGMATGFHPSVHRELKRSGDFFDYLEGLISLNEELVSQLSPIMGLLKARMASIQGVSNRSIHINSKDIMQYMEEISINRDILQQLYDESTKLIVQLDPDLKRSIEQLLQVTSTNSITNLISGQNAASSSTSKPSQSNANKTQVPKESNDVDYWSSEAEYVPDATRKRSRLEAPLDSLLSLAESKGSSQAVNRTIPAISKRPRKANVCLKCLKELKQDKNLLQQSEVYCSDSCAVATIPEYLKSLLKYRKILLLHSLKNTHPDTNHINAMMDGEIDDIIPSGNQKEIVPLKDMKAFEMLQLDKNEMMTEVIRYMMRFGINESTISSTWKTKDPMDAKNELDQFMAFKNDPSFSLNENKPKGWTATESIKPRLTGMAQLCRELSTGSQQILVKSSDAIDAVSPKQNMSFNLSSSSSNQLSDADNRSLVRSGFEDIFVSCLLKHHISGAYEQACVWAHELEEELYQKHCTVAAGSTSGVKEWNKKEYKNQQLMIRRNLKQSHNDHLILGIVSHKTTLEKVLNMSSQDFADVSTKLKREQEHENFMKDAEIKQRSMQDEIEAHRRQTMTGQAESWRQGEKGSVSTSAPLKDIPSQEESMYENAVKLNENTGDETGDGNTTGKRKRPLDGDKSKSIAKRSNKGDEDMIDVSTNDLNAMYPDIASEPGSMKPPNIITLLEEQSANAKREKILNEKGSVRLICNDGSTAFQIAQPGTSPIQCTAAITDRRVQGLIKPFVSIDYRTKIADLEKFIIQSSASGRKIIATCYIFVKGASSPESGYSRLCKDYTEDRKAGLQNVKENVQFYIIPPQLKGALTILRSLEGQDTSHTLYGIIVAREEGPAKYVQMSMSSFNQYDVDDDGQPMAKSPEYDTMTDDTANDLSIHQMIMSNVSYTPNAIPPVASAIPRPILGQPRPLVPQNVLNIPHSLPINAGVPRGVPAAVSGLNFAPRPMNALGLPPAFNIPRPLSVPSNNLPLKPLMPPQNAGLAIPIANPRGITMPRPLSGLPMPSMAGMNAPRAVATGQAQVPSFDSQPFQKQRDIVRQVAQFCIDNGPETIAFLKNKDTARMSTPFLFEGHSAFNEFHGILKQLLGRGE